MMAARLACLRGAVGRIGAVVALLVLGTLAVAPSAAADPTPPSPWSSSPLGAVLIVVSIPASTTGPTGQTSSEQPVLASSTVLATLPASPGRGPLAFTGFDLASWLMLAAVALLAGGLLVLMGRTTVAREPAGAQRRDRNGGRR